MRGLGVRQGEALVVGGVHAHGLLAHGALGMGVGGGTRLWVHGPWIHGREGWAHSVGVVRVQGGAGCAVLKDQPTPAATPTWYVLRGDWLWSGKGMMEVHMPRIMAAP